MWIRGLLILMLGTLVLLTFPVPASAQWYLEGALGGNHTLDTNVSIRQTSTDLALDFHDVRFAAVPNAPRRYYAVRAGQRWGRLGWEVEQIHLKAVADTSRAYDVTVVSGTPPAQGAQPMNLVVQEYEMTHGVNLVVLNLVFRRALGDPATGRMTAALRVGAGASFPHAETTVNGGSVHHYEYGGPGGQAAAALYVRLWPRVAALAEYKFTYTRPRIDIDGGTGWTTLVSHHLVAGVSLDLTH